MSSLGPVQLLVVGLDRPDSQQEVVAEFGRLRESDVVRVIDLLVVQKGTDGVVLRARGCRFLCLTRDFPDASLSVHQFENVGGIPVDFKRFGAAG